MFDAVRSYRAGLSSDAKAVSAFCMFPPTSDRTHEVYGSLGPDEAAFIEVYRYEPNSPYSASKAASDHLVRAWHHTYGLPVMTTNCSNNFCHVQSMEICRSKRRVAEVYYKSTGFNRWKNQATFL